MKSSVAVVVLFLLAVRIHAAEPPAPQRPDSTEPWKVEEAHGPFHTITFDTDEGTWIDLDVSPDGTTIAFSLLGDLYLLPASGGSARRITSGSGYDVQPRFSPDGQWVAFASDRGGTENLWTADAGNRRDNTPAVPSSELLSITSVRCGTVCRSRPSRVASRNAAARNVTRTTVTWGPGVMR